MSKEISPVARAAVDSALDEIGIPQSDNIHQRLGYLVGLFGALKAAPPTSVATTPAELAVRLELNGHERAIQALRAAEDKRSREDFRVSEHHDEVDQVLQNVANALTELRAKVASLERITTEQGAELRRIEGRHDSLLGKVTEQGVKVQGLMQVLEPQVEAVKAIGDALKRLERSVDERIQAIEERIQNNTFIVAPDPE